jgi:thymidylate synthase (FAD)
MKVLLLAHTVITDKAIEHFNEVKKDGQFIGTEAEKLTEIAGRTCYDSFGKGRNSDDYHKHIIDVGHGSVLEHCSVTVLISGVSRGLTHELIRHRVGTAVSQRSTRYVDEDESEVIGHPLLRCELHEDAYCDSLVAPLFKDSDEDESPEYFLLEEKIEECKNRNRELYRDVINYMEPRLIEKGFDKATARKQARGAARGFLENGMETELVFTMNLRAMLNIISQRAVGAADAEIRVLAEQFVKIGKLVAPAYFNRIQLENGVMTNNPKDVRI